MKKQFLISLGAAALLVACGTTESELGMGAKFEDLPESVQSSVKQKIGDAQVLDIDMERRTGTEVYEITYEQSDGMKQKLHVRQDGTILSQRQAGAKGLMNEAAGAFRGEKDAEVDVNVDTDADADVDADVNYEQRGEFNQQGAAQGEFKSSATTQQGTSATYSSGTSQSSSLDTQSRDYSLNAESDTDADAEIKAEASGTGAEFKAEADVDADVDADANIAPEDRIQAKREVRGGAEGLLQKGSLEANEAAGAGVKRETSIDASASTDASSSSTSSELEVSRESAGAEKKGSLAGQTTISFNELPEAVKNALRDHGGENAVRNIKHSKVYTIEFKDADKHGHEKICVSEDGTLMEK